MDPLSDTNTSILPTTANDDLLFHCWPHFTCETCLASPYPCAWCATSSSCVPNDLFPSPFGILTPLKSDSICPLAWRERWEMRSKPFSCRCSTMTLMSVVVAVLGTLVGLVLLWELWCLGRWSVRRWRERRPGWWRVYRAEWWGLGKGRKGRWLGGRSTATQTEGEEGQGGTEDGERQPLLG